MQDGKYEVKDNQLVKIGTGEPIPEDEPIFILRGRDHLAVSTIEMYRMLATANGCTPYHLDKCEQALGRFKDFRDQHPERMKQPGITMGK